MKFNHLAHSLLVPGVVAWNHVSGSELSQRAGDNEWTLAAFVMPNDKPSQALESEWASLQQTEGNAVVSIDCSAETELCQESGIASFPAIRLLPSSPDNKPLRYRGPRTASAIRSFLRRASRPAVSHVNPDNATAFQSVDDIVLIGHFGPNDAWLRQAFETAAQTYHDRYSFAVLAAGAQQKAAVDCYNNADDVQQSTVDFSSPTAIETFVKRCSTPLIPELTRRNELSFYETRKSIVHYLPPTPQHRASYVAAIRPLAKKYAEYLHFVTTDTSEFPDAAALLGLLGTTGGGAGGLSVQNPNNGEVYPYRRGGEISAAVVEAFLGDIIQGKVKTWTGEAAGGRDEL